MFMRLATRGVHLCTAFRQMPKEKSNLAALRKCTGYTFANCKKALEINNNDLKMAENWLQQQAQALGWQKANKLEGRKTKQGLVAALIQAHSANMVEVNCETDFVARNENFIDFVTNASKSCQEYIEKHDSSSIDDDTVGKVSLSPEELSKLTTPTQKRLDNELALLIGNVGENAALRRALCIKTSPNIVLVGHAHPQNTHNNVLYGKYATVVALKSTDPSNDSNKIHVVGKNLCQHIIGMNPQKIGSAHEDTPSENADDERCLIFQELLTDPSKLVCEYLEENGVVVVDFKRFECGEE